MKRHFLVAVTIALLTYPSTCFPAYFIVLKNGNQLVVPSYWEEGGDIKFQLRGGVVSISKDSVSKITPSHLAYKEQTDTGEQSIAQKNVNGVSILPFSRPAQIGKGDARAEKGASIKKTSKGAVDLEYYREKRKQLRSKLDEARETFWKASGDKDSETKNKAVHDIAQISGQLSELTDELRRNNECELPEWWKDE